MVKLEIKNIQDVPNTVDIIITGETHTAASAIVENLNSNPDTLYSAYKVSHPYDDFVSIRISSKNNESPISLFKNTLSQLTRDLDSLITSVEEQC